MILRYASDCSGLDAPLVSLKKLKIDFEYLFASEVDKKLYNNIKTNYKPKLIFDNILTRDHTKLPKKLDLYIAGFPCPSFSTASRFKEGFNSERGSIFFHCYTTIKHTKPKYFILENVKGLITHNKGETLKIIKEYFDLLPNYTMYYEVINSKYFTPQNRTRIYIIGIKNAKKKYNFDLTNKKEKHIKTIIDTKNTNKIKLSNTKQQLLNKIIKHKKINIKDWWIINLNTSCINYATSNLNLSPTILTSSQMYYITPLQRFMTINELAKLQGLQSLNLDFLTKTEQYKALGNSMTSNVITFIIKTLLNL